MIGKVCFLHIHLGYSPEAGKCVTLPHLSVLKKLTKRGLSTEKPISVTKSCTNRDVPASDSKQEATGNTAFCTSLKKSSIKYTSWLP